MRYSRRGFTLIEILVVVAIILLLASVLLVSFSGVFGKSNEAQAKATIETLGANIESYQSRWGIPPPSSMSELGMLVNYPMLTAPNQQNNGIETMVLALRSRREQGPYLDPKLFADTDRRANQDIDTVIEEVMAPEFLDIEDGTSRDLFEIIDPWGNPFVYLDMKSVRAGLFQTETTLADGSSTKIDPVQLQNALRHPTTGAYPTSYIIYSFGPDGINNYGRDDDITSWPKYEQD